MPQLSFCDIVKHVPFAPALAVPGGERRGIPVRGLSPKKGNQAAVRESSARAGRRAVRSGGRAMVTVVPSPGALSIFRSP